MHCVNPTIMLTPCRAISHPKFLTPTVNIIGSSASQLEILFYFTPKLIIIITLKEWPQEQRAIHSWLTLDIVNSF